MAHNITVADAMTSSPKVILRKASIVEASKKMVESGVGSLMVVEGGKSVGIITKTDIIEKVVLARKDPSKLKVKDVMSRKVVSTTPNVSLSRAAKKMVRLGLRRLVVIEKGDLVGLLTQTDVLRVQPSAVDLLADKFINASSIDVRRVQNVKGVCDGCGATSFLVLHEGSMLCQNCLGAVQ